MSDRGSERCLATRVATPDKGSTADGRTGFPAAAVFVRKTTASSQSAAS